jgi:amidophosphoribosyltransferase
MRISSPATIGPCYYGIDTPTRGELIASSSSVEEIRRYIDADSLAYLSHDGMYAYFNGRKQGFCDACFTGNYPVHFEDEGITRQLHLFDALNR